MSTEDMLALTDRITRAFQRNVNCVISPTEARKYVYAPPLCRPHRPGRGGPDVAGFEACREAAIEYWSDWLVDAVAGATQDRKFIRGDDKEDIMATGAILNNGRKAIKSAIAALPAPAGESVTGWQDIETAPKDGTEIIGIYFRPEDGLFKVTIYGPWTIAFDRGKWRSSWGRSEVIEYMGDFGTDYKEPDCEPTHWCPLPAFTITRKGEARS